MRVELQIYFQAVSSFLCLLRTILFILLLPLVQVSWASYLTSPGFAVFIWDVCCERSLWCLPAVNIFFFF